MLSVAGALVLIAGEKSNYGFPSSIISAAFLHVRRVVQDIHYFEHLSNPSFQLDNKDQMAGQDPAVGKQSPTPSETDRIKPPPSSAAEDPDTAAARKELRNTAISDKPDLAPSSAMASSAAADTAATDSDTASARNNTPDHENKMKDQISSPKKKRAHDEVDQNKDSTQDANGDVSPLGADANPNRTDRSEPEKKRPRDVSSETKAAAQNNTVRHIICFFSPFSFSFRLPFFHYWQS